MVEDRWVTGRSGGRVFTDGLGFLITLFFSDPHFFSSGFFCGWAFTKLRVWHLVCFSSLEVYTRQESREL